MYKEIRYFEVELGIELSNGAKIVLLADGTAIGNDDNIYIPILKANRKTGLSRVYAWFIWKKKKR